MSLFYPPGLETTSPPGTYDMTVVTDEELAQAGILKYVLGQSVKKQLVERVEDWPGVHPLPALLEGEP
jgi:hypothetical protein